MSGWPAVRRVVPPRPLTRFTMASVRRGWPERKRAPACMRCRGPARSSRIRPAEAGPSPGDHLPDLPDRSPADLEAVSGFSGPRFATGLPVRLRCSDLHPNRSSVAGDVRECLVLDPLSRKGFREHSRRSPGKARFSTGRRRLSPGRPRLSPGCPPSVHTPRRGDQRADRQAARRPAEERASPHPSPAIMHFGGPI